MSEEVSQGTQHILRDPGLWTLDYLLTISIRVGRETDYSDEGQPYPVYLSINGESTRFVVNLLVDGELSRWCEGPFRTSPLDPEGRKK